MISSGVGAGICSRGSLLFLCFILTAVPGCTQKEDESKLNVFHGSEKDDVKSWDPAYAYDRVSLDILPSIYETLYQYSYLSVAYKIEPLLAAAMPTFSADRLTLTIPIKQGVYFQDDPCFKGSHGKGRELKAQDFVNGMKRLALSAIESRGWWILDQKVVGVNAFHDKFRRTAKKDFDKAFAEEIEGLKAISPYTLQIKLTKPYPDLLYILSMSLTAPVALEALAAYSDEKGNISNHAVGTGPFILKKWKKNQEIILDRNKNFRSETYPSEASSQLADAGMLEDQNKALPFLDRITFSIIQEDQPRWLNFMKGDLDAIKLPKDNFKQSIINQVNLSPALVKKGIRLNIEKGVVIRYLSFNLKDKILGANKYLRQAISSAIDRDRWIRVFTNSTAKKMVSAVPKGVKDRPIHSKIKYDFNLSLSKELMKKAGFPGGKGLPPLRFDLRGASNTERQLGEFIRSQLEPIGIHAEVVLNTLPEFLEKRRTGNFQISDGAWSMDYPDAENIYQLFYGPNQAPGPGEASYNNSEFNNIYSKVAISESGPERAQWIQQMDNLIQEDCPWVFGYYEASFALSQPWLLNYRGNLIINNKYKYYRIDKELRARYYEAL
jgi:oligopeptide transport system substrate-binding protein